MVSFIMQNDMTKLEHLTFADHPGGWLGADRLSESELEAVWDIRLLYRARSR